MTTTLEVHARGEGVRISVQVKPRASRSGIIGIKQGALIVALGARPVAGAANEELVEVLAGVLGVRRAAVTIASGVASRRKLLDVRGVSVADVRARLAQVQGG
jgi:uncharacterized protein (TIGR00251 family)